MLNYYYPADNACMSILFHQACESGDCNAIDYLFRNNKFTFPLADVCTPLHVAVTYRQLNIVELLLSYGLDIEVKDANGYTALHLSSKEGFTEIADLLLRKGAFVSSLNMDKSTPLHLAAASGHADTVKLLLSYGANKFDFNLYDYTPVHEATERGHIDIVKIFLESGGENFFQEGNYYSDSPLHIASALCDREIVNLLLLYGVKVNVRNGKNFTPLHYACREGYEDIVTILLNNNADVNCHNSNGDTPLHLCTSSRDSQIMKLLILHGADPRRKNKENQNIFQLLKHENADVNISEYLKEIKKMRKTNLNNKFTLYSFLFMNRNLLARHVNNVILSEMYNQDRFSLIYPHYGSILNGHYEKGIKRRIFLDLAASTLQIIVNHKLNQDFCLQILVYLKDSDLENLISAYTGPNAHLGEEFSCSD